MKKYAFTVTAVAVVLIVALTYMLAIILEVKNMAQTLLDQPAAISRMSVDELEWHIQGLDDTENMDLILTGVTFEMQSKIIDLFLMALD